MSNAQLSGIASVLDAAAERSRLGVSELAGTLGVSTASLWRWRTGRAHPSPRGLTAIADFCGRTPLGVLVDAAGGPATVAENVGVSRGTLWRWVTGRFHPTAEHINSLAWALDVPTTLLTATIDGPANAAATTASKTTRRRVPPPVVAGDNPASFGTGAELTAPHPTLGGYAAKWCAHRSHMDYDPNYPDELKEEDTPFTLALMEAGNVRERDVAEAFAAALDSTSIDCSELLTAAELDVAVAAAATSGSPLVLLDGDRSHESLAAREYATHALLATPGSVQVIWNARLRKWRREADGSITWGRRASEPDFLYRQGDAPASDGTWKWGPGDVKDHNPFEGTAKARVWPATTLTDPLPAGAFDFEAEGTFKKVDGMQLAHYQRHLEFHGVAGDPVGGIIGKPFDGHGYLIIWSDLGEALYEYRKTSALEYYDRAFAERIAVVDTAVACGPNPGTQPRSVPEWKAECKTCPWRKVCHEQLVLADHITLLPGITPARAAAHYAAGVTTVEQLASLDSQTAALIDAKVPDLPAVIDDARSGAWEPNAPAAWLLTGAKPAVITAVEAAGVLTVADLMVLDDRTAAYEPAGGSLVAAIDQARVVDHARVRKYTHVFRARGTDEVSVPRGQVEIHVDMENDDHIYLWGAYLVVRDGSRTSTEYHPFVSWSADDAGEADAIARFWTWFSDQRTQAHQRYGPDGFKAFYYTAAENRCLRHLAKKHAGVAGVPTEAELEELLNSADWVDLYPLLTKPLIWPTEDLTLKSLAKYVRFMWRDEDPSGSASVVWYRIATTDEDPQLRDAYRRRILDYNEDDVRATHALVEWVSRFAEVWNPTSKLPSVVELERRYDPVPSAA